MTLDWDPPRAGTRSGIILGETGSTCAHQVLVMLLGGGHVLHHHEGERPQAERQGHGGQTCPQDPILSFTSNSRTVQEWERRTQEWWDTHGTVGQNTNGEGGRELAKRRENVLSISSTNVHTEECCTLILVKAIVAGVQVIGRSSVNGRWKRRTAQLRHGQLCSTIYRIIYCMARLHTKINHDCTHEQSCHCFF